MMDNKDGSDTSRHKIELRLLDSLNHLVSIEIECDAGMVEWRLEQVRGIFGERLVGYVERKMEEEEQCLTLKR